MNLKEILKQLLLKLLKKLFLKSPSVNSIIFANEKIGKCHKYKE